MQSVSAICIARKYLQSEGYDISFRPEFVHIEMTHAGQQTTGSAMRFYILSQQL
jgi:stage V sporulation protein SpoVS